MPHNTPHTLIVSGLLALASCCTAKTRFSWWMCFPCAGDPNLRHAKMGLCSFRTHVNGHLPQFAKGGMSICHLPIGQGLHCRPLPIMFQRHKKRSFRRLVFSPHVDTYRMVLLFCQILLVLVCHPRWQFHLRSTCLQQLQCRMLVLRL